MKLNKSKIINVKNGKNLKIVEPVNIYGVIFGDNCFVGPFTEIQKNVKIGNNTKIQSHNFICEMVNIGKNCFISHGTVFINDKFSDGNRAYGNKNKWKKTIVGNDVLIGSNSTILPVKICSNVIIGAGSVVTKNITTSGKYVGNPARKIKVKKK